MNGEKIRNLRAKMGLSRAKFGEMLGRSGVMVYNYETERYAVPPVVNLALQALEKQHFGDQGQEQGQEQEKKQYSKQ